MLYYHARYYDPGLAKFVSADTAAANNPQSLNRYAYVNNNPLNLTDPSGNCPANRQSDVDWCASYDKVYAHRGWQASGTALEGLSIGELENIFNWLERGLTFKDGNTLWTADTLKSVLQGLNRIYNAYYTFLDSIGELGRLETLLRRIFTGIIIRINRPVSTVEGGSITSGCYNSPRAAVCPDNETDTIDLYYNPNDSYAAPGQALERLTNLVIHEVGHVVDKRLGYYSQQQAWERIVNGDPNGSSSNYRGDNPLSEDFAETFTWWVGKTAGGSQRAPDEPLGGRQTLLDKSLNKF